jgi:hypothetical protein
MNQNMSPPKDPIKYQEWRDKLSASHKGQPAWNKGKQLTDSHRSHLKEAKKGVWSGENNPFFGKTHSQKSITQMKTSHKGQIAWNKGIPISEQQRKQISETLKERCKDPNVLKQLTEQATGVYPSEETRLKLIESHLEGGFWYGNVKHTEGVVYCGVFTPTFKEGVRKLQKYTCMECGHVWQPGERRLAVHHVYYNKKSCCTQNEEGLYIQTIPNGESKGMKILVEGNPNKFAALCSTKGSGCHGKTNHNRLHWARKYEKIINEQYGGLSYTPINKNKIILKEE